MIRCVLCGRVSSGKSSLLYALRHGTAKQYGGDATIGVAYMRWKNMDIWDTAGQEQYRTLMALYFRRMHAALVMFDLSSRVSFDETNYWTDEVRKHSPHARILLIGCKADLLQERRVSKRECMLKAEQLRAQYWETSAHQGAGVEAPFRHLLEDTSLETRVVPPDRALELDNVRGEDSWYNSTGSCCGAA